MLTLTSTLLRVCCQICCRRRHQRLTSLMTSTLRLTLTSTAQLIKLTPNSVGLTPKRKSRKSEIWNLGVFGTPEHRTLPEKKIWNGKFRGLWNTNGAPLRYPTIKNATSEHQLSEYKKSKIWFLGVFGTPEHRKPKVKKAKDLILRGLRNTGPTPNTWRPTELGVTKGNTLGVAYRWDVHNLVAQDAMW